MKTADVIIIGAGVAGLSLAAVLSPYVSVVLLEAEGALGFRSSGRSATLSHFGIGHREVRALTAYSQDEFHRMRDAEHHAAISRTTAALFVAHEQNRRELETLAIAMEQFAPIEALNARMIERIVPALRVGGDGITGGVIDRTALKLDADLLLQHYASSIRKHGGRIELNAPISDISFRGSSWRVRSSGDAFDTPILVNAAGAWADHVALSAGVSPLQLEPRRRTIIVFNPPDGLDTRAWPFVRSVSNDFYMLPEGSRLLASPSDETLSEPCNAQPDEYDVALAADRVEHYTSLEVRRISAKWAGLRTFTKDRIPVAGFAPDAQGFFWLAGQGGYGLQTAPALAAAASALILGNDWPKRLSKLGVTPETLAATRFS